MAEYFWLGPSLGIPDRKAFNTLRKFPVGSKSNSTNKLEIPEIALEMVREAKLPRSRYNAALNYLASMDLHFQQATNCLKENGYYALVIGNSQTKDGMLPVHNCLIRLAEVHNLQLDKAFGYRIRRHYMKFPRKGRGGIILIDWILVFKKSNKRSLTSKNLPLTWVKLKESAVAN